MTCKVTAKTAPPKLPPSCRFSINSTNHRKVQKQAHKPAGATFTILLITFIIVFFLPSSCVANTEPQSAAEGSSNRLIFTDGYTEAPNQAFIDAQKAMILEALGLKTAPTRPPEFRFKRRLPTMGSPDQTSLEDALHGLRRRSRRLDFKPEIKKSGLDRAMNRKQHADRDSSIRPDPQSAGIRSSRSDPQSAIRS